MSANAKIQAILDKLSKDFPQGVYVGRNYTLKMLMDDLQSIQKEELTSHKEPAIIPPTSKE